MKQTIKLFALLCLSLIVTLLMASCNDISDIPLGNETTPEATTPTETLSTEPTTPVETTTEVPVETTEAPAETTEAPVDETTTEAPAETTTEAPNIPTDPYTEHEMVDGQCTKCGFVPVFEKESVYDNDGDGANDTYLFTPILPEKFRGEDVVHLWAMDYIPELSSSYVSDKNMFATIWDNYCQPGCDEYFTYKVTVPEAGVYEMAIHTRLRDTKARGAKITINKDTENEYAFELSYQFATEEELNAARENDYTYTSYVYSIRVELQAGDNYLRIDEATQDLRIFYFRDFYFVKVDDLTPHYHEFVDGKCECGFVPPVLENESVYDNDGDGKNDVYLFTAALPEKFRGEDAVHLWAGDYVPELSRLYVIVDSFFPIREWSCSTGSGDYYVYKITVPETGIYEMAIHTHLWATKARGAKFTVNKDTENEYTFELSYQFTTEEASAAMENDYTRTSYMYGIQVELQAGDNYIRIEEPTQDLRAFYFRNFYFVKVEE